MEKATPLPHGVYAAALTPMNPDLSPDIAKLVAHCQWLKNAGATGLALLGTTGEANSFSLSEKMDLLKQSINDGMDPENVMVGTGSTSYHETTELSKFAFSLGFKHILLLPPFYYKQVTDQGLFDYFKRVVDGLNNPGLGIYLYHIPKLTGVHLSMHLIEKLLNHFPGQFLGMKDSSGDLQHMQQVISEFPGFDVFAGTEKYLLPVLRSGGAGCISATANLTVKMVAELFHGWKSGKADHYQEEITAIRSTLEQYPLVGILKALMAHFMEDTQWQHTQPPNSLASSEDVTRCLAGLKEADFDPGFG